MFVLECVLDWWYYKPEMKKTLSNLNVELGCFSVKSIENCDIGSAEKVFQDASTGKSM